MRIETMPDGSTWTTIPVLWRQGGGLLEPGDLTVYQDRGPIRHGSTDGLMNTSKGGPLMGWGAHDCEVSAVLTADGCGWECTTDLETWRATVLALSNA